MKNNLVYAKKFIFIVVFRGLTFLFTNQNERNAENFTIAVESRYLYIVIVVNYITLKNAIRNLAKNVRYSRVPFVKRDDIVDFN